MGLGQARAMVDARRFPRYGLKVEIRVYPRHAPVVRGETVDISASGISAMLREEVPLGELVRLEFSVSSGDVEVHAMVRQRNAFRYGFQFVEDNSAQELIRRTCRELALEQAIAAKD
jgi:c-di-GMP-binding flagellar brake protein YcgR